MSHPSTKNSFLDRWMPRGLNEARSVFREGGFKGVLQRYGWKFFAFFFLYYLIRDVTLYLVLPWYFASKVL